MECVANKEEHLFFIHWSIFVAICVTLIQQQPNKKMEPSGMCEFAGNRHKQFGTNYLYVRSEKPHFVCVLFVFKSRFGKEDKGTRC